MPRTDTASPEANEYRSKVTGETVGAYVGTELDGVYASDSDYEAVGERSTAAQAPTEPEPTGSPDDDGTDGEQAVDLESLNRDELNTLAKERGIEEPEGLPNKGEVKAAITAAQAPTEEG
jgi:hypothetical protein